MNAVDVRTSRLDADVWDLTGSTMTRWRNAAPDEPGGKIYAVIAIIYALFAGATVLVMLPHVHE